MKNIAFLFIFLYFAIGLCKSDDCQPYFSDSSVVVPYRCNVFQKCCGTCDERYCCLAFLAYDLSLDQTLCNNSIVIEPTTKATTIATTFAPKIRIQEYNIFLIVIVVCALLLCIIGMITRYLKKNSNASRVDTNDDDTSVDIQSSINRVFIGFFLIFFDFFLSDHEDSRQDSPPSYESSVNRPYVIRISNNSSHKVVYDAREKPPPYSCSNVNS